MNQDILRQIKSDMINYIIFYGTKFKNPDELKNFFKSSKLEIGNVSESDLVNLEGRLNWEIYNFKTNNSPIRNFIRNEWRKRGYAEEAQEAFISINVDEILERANGAGISIETFEEVSDSRKKERADGENRRKKLSGNDVWILFLYFIGFLIFIGAALRFFGFTEASNDKMDVIRYKVCKDAGDMGDRWDCEERLKKQGLR